MDIQTGLLCVTVAIISAVVIYVISMSTMKEKTYDEAMADLRRRTDEQFPEERTVKDKKDKKIKKKAGKKVKEKNASAAVSGDEHIESDVDGGANKNHVAFIEPTVAVMDANISVKERKRPNKKKDKPILLNRNEHSLVTADSPAAVQNHFEKIHPKDDFELKRSHSREEIKVPNTTSTAVTAPVSPAKEQQSKKQGSKGGAATGNKVAEQKNNNQPLPKPQRSQPTQSNESALDKNVTDNIPSSVTQSSNNPANVDRKEVVPKQVDSVVQQPSFSSNPSTPSHNEKLTASPSIKMSKKMKSDFATLNQISSDHREVISINLLLPLVGKAELSKSEVQLLIDFLLNKQQGTADSSAEWIEGRQDPVVKLKKQLADKEKALTDELEAVVGLQARLKEIRAELNAEKHNNRTLEEALHARQNEVSSIAMKLQHAVEEKQAMAQQIQQVQAKLGEERLIVRKLQEDGGQAQSAFQQELLTQRQQLEMHIARLGETQHQQQETITSLEAQLGDRMQTSDALTSELTLIQERTAHLQDAAAQAQELARQVEELRNVRSNLEHVLAANQYDNKQLQTQIGDLSEQLNHLQSENENLNLVIQNVESDNTRLRETNELLTVQVSSVSVEAKQLRNENETLAAQVTASMERPATEGRENGDANNYSEEKLSHVENRDNIHKQELLLEELENKLKMKEMRVENLTGEVNTYKTELMEQQRLVQVLKDQVEKHRQEAEQLSKELLQQKTQATNLIEQLNSQQAKNDDLRKKNGKVMEALATTEKLLRTKMSESDRLVTEAVTSAAEKMMLQQQSSTRQLLQRVFPELTVPECKNQLDWYQEVEKALNQWKPLQADNQNSSDLEKQNAQLQAMVSHYKNIIADTEGMLNRLQSHVEQEEGKWSEEMQALHSQLEAVTRERDALQASGSTERASNGYNHVDTANQTSSKRRRFTGWLRKRFGLKKLRKHISSTTSKRKRYDSV